MMRAMFLVALLASLVLAPGTPVQAGHQVWALDDSYKLNPRTGAVYAVAKVGDVKRGNPVWEAVDRRVRIAGARNEVVAFQLIIEGGVEGLREVSVVPEDLKGPATIGRDRISLSRVHYTEVTAASKWPGPSTGPGWYPDALIPFDAPRDGAPFSVPPNFAQAVWVDVAIPADTPPGAYQGTLGVRVAGEAPDPVPVRLTVWDFTLPFERHLRFWTNYGDLERPFGIDRSKLRDLTRLAAIERQLWQLSHEHRIEALHRYAMVHPRITSAGLDWTDFDQRYGLFLDGTLFRDRVPPGIFLLPPILHEGKRWPPPGEDAAFAVAVKETAAHWKAKGWRLEDAFIYLGDEPKSDPAVWEEIKRHARMAKAAAPEIRTTVAFNRLSPRHIEEFAGLVDFWLIDAAHYSTKLLHPRKAAGDWVGFYQQGEPWVGNETLDTDALGLRTWPWIAWKYRVDVLYLYLMTYWVPWRKGFDIWTNPRNWGGSNAQGVLVYPGTRIGVEGVVPSVRLKMVRRGMQDYEYFWLAKQRGGDPDPVVSRIIRRALDEATRPEYTAGEWSRDPADWARARAELAAMITSSPPQPAGGG